MALVTIRRSSSVQTPQKRDEIEKSSENADDNGSKISKSLNECYFANKGAALVLGGTERCADRQVSTARVHPQPDIQQHLQDMFYLLRPEETLKMAVKLESAHAGRTRYLVVVCHGEEAALLGIDCNERTTVGLVLRVLANTAIKLDGDGGFSVCVCNQQHIFKPVSVQAMWSALQTLHRGSARARELNHFAGGTSHSWAAHYERRVDSDRSCLNEWHAMDSIESRRPPSPDSLRHKPRERNETERVIRCTLKEIMMSVDLDEVTSKAIRGRLEAELDMDLAEYKPFIDHEMLTILGQMDAPTEVFEHVYLGSEWNASNLEELQRNGVRHILNVTREIDNFFPGMFDYLNVRVYDDEKTDLLKHWDNTFKYINKARNDGSKVLVHCKMGISRSASVVIAYAMKAYNWNFDKALKHVKMKRNCIKPNTNFLNQLETYQGILDAMKNKEKLQRSKSETNLKSPKTVSKIESKAIDRAAPQAFTLTGSYGGRPRSWSPDTKLASELLPPTSVSLENLASETRHMLMPCANGSYSVSPNQIIRLKEEGAPSVKHIVNEIENIASSDKKDFSKRYQKLNFGNEAGKTVELTQDAISKPLQVSPLRNLGQKYGSAAPEADNIHTWDPGETYWPKNDDMQNSDIDNIVKSDSGIIDIKAKMNDAFSNFVDRNVDSDDTKKQAEEDALPPSRQSSWSSFDSAVVPDLSRHSSWGSYDTRARPLAPPPRDDSAKKRDRLDEPAKSDALRAASDLSIITEQMEARGLRRPAIDISDNERKFNETCAILKELAEAARGRGGVGGANTWAGPLSASAPETYSRAGLRRRRLAAASHGDLSAPPAPRAPPLGLVSNLKKEFEARSGTAPALPPAASRVDDAAEPPPAPPAASPRRIKARSLPDRSTSVTEDRSVKVLVDRYDSHRCKSKCDSNCETAKAKASHELVSKKCKLNSDNEGKVKASSAFLRNSFCGALRGGGGIAGAGGAGERPPPAPHVVSLAPLSYPGVVVSTVMSKAQNKKQLQHGKTHPLTRLNMNRSNNRCSNPVYNTM